MVQLAPHLVRPLPLVVPAFGGERARPARRRRPEPLRRDVGRPPAPAPQRAATGRGRAWAPDRHRIIPGDEVVERLPALAGARPDARATSSTTARPTTPPRADRAGRGRALRRGLRQPARGDRARRGGRPRARRPRAGRGDGRGRSIVRGRQRRQRDRRLGRPAAARTSCTTRPRSRASARAAGRTSRCPTTGCRSIAGAIVPAGGGRSIFALPWLGVDADRHDRQRLRRRRTSTTSARPTATSSTCWTPTNALLRHRPDGAATSAAPSPACGR